MPIASIIVRAVALVSLLAATAHAQQQTGAQQSCINSFNKAAVRVTAARARSFNGCVLEAMAGRRHVETCYTFDPDAKIAAAQAKLAQVESARCDTAPDFGHGALVEATGAASAQVVDLLRQLHLMLPPALPSSESECVGAIDDLTQKLLQAKLKAFAKCKKSGLAQGTVTSPATLGACLDAAKAAVDARTAKLVAAAEQAVTKSCTSSSSFQGCGDQSPSGIAACVDRVADCRACEFAARVDGATADCDSFDDTVLNDSCPNACGDGAVGQGLPSWQAESCDDANFTNGDGCDYNCTVSGCGNGVAAGGEFCDGANGHCSGGELDGAPCDLNEQCGTGFCTSCPPGGCANDCSACGAGICCDTMFGCLFAYDGADECSASGGTPVACDALTCQHSGTCCKDLYLDWQGCHSDPNVLANCEDWGGHFAPCTECKPCCAFDGYCTSWHAAQCLEYEGTPVDCDQCWTP